MRPRRRPKVDEAFAAGGPRIFERESGNDLLSQPGMRKLGALEVFRFGLYFLAVKRDPKAFVEWLKLVRLAHQD